MDEFNFPFYSASPSTTPLYRGNDFYQFLCLSKPFSVFLGTEMFMKYVS